MSLDMKLAYTVDVNAPLVTIAPVTLLMQGDAKANTVRLTVTDGGEPYDLSGLDATLYLRRQDGVSVRNPGEVAGNVASVTLDPSCYSVPGSYAAMLVLSNANFRRTMLRLAGYVEDSGQGTVIDPSGSIPSYEQLEALFEQMEDSLQASSTATENANTAAQSANTAAGTANTAAKSANTAAGNANSAAAGANTAKDAANAAAVGANVARDNANAAAGAATTAADNANAAAEEANEAADKANALRAPTIYIGTAITGTSTTPTAYATGIADARVGDLYAYNGTDAANVGNVYRCEASGNQASALWAFMANWRGAAGEGSVSFVDGVGADGGGNVALGAVRYKEQTLTDEQKMQARANIGAGTGDGTVLSVDDV